MKGKACVELDKLGNPVRIFRTLKSSFLFDGPCVLMSKRAAISAIRLQVWHRTKGECEFCATPISEQSMHCHELVHRGEGGEISLKNCVGVCYECHFSDFETAHGDRVTRFGEEG